MRRFCSVLAVVCVGLALTLAATTDAKPRRRAGVLVARVGTFTQPTYLTAPPGDRRRLFVVERAGRIIEVRDGRIRRTPFLDMRADVLIRAQREDQDQRGLLSVAFAPDYAKSGRLYVFYTGRDDALHVAELHRSRRNADRADLSTLRDVIDLGASGPFGQGGQLQFGPGGLLYIGVGDGDVPRLAQDLSSLRGKILRIDPRRSGARPYSVPASNPLAGAPGARAEIFAYGLREPWRFSFAPRTHTLLLGDVGADTAEEVDVLRSGFAGAANFGWPTFEGFVRHDSATLQNYVPPALQKLHSQGWCAVIGGYVGRDRSVPALYGRYVYGDLCTGSIRSAVIAGSGLRGDRLVGGSPAQIASFGEDGRGRLYIVGATGNVYRLVKG